MKRFAFAAAALLTAGLLVAADAPKCCDPTAATKACGDKTAAAAAKLGWKLGSQTYTLRDRSLLEAIETLCGLGIQYAECYPGQPVGKEFNGPDGKPVKFGPGLPKEAEEAVKKKLETCKVKVISFGVTQISNDEAAARKLFDFAKSFGIQTIVTEAPKENFPLIEKLAAEYCIRVALHNHPDRPNKPNIYGRPERVVAALEGGYKNIGACADVGHWARTGITPVDGLKQLQGKITELHFKDLNAVCQLTATDVPWGTGASNAKAMMEELKRQGFKGAFMIEYETGKGDELVANMAKCVEFFGKTCEDLAK